MRTTGFTRTATRWLSYSRMVLAGLAAACASSTIRVYDPPQTAARISRTELHDRLAEMMVIDCPRLLATRARRHGAVHITLSLDSAGRVERASIRRGSGDASFDDVAGGLAARLRLAPPPHVLASDPPTRRLTVFYLCTPGASDVRTRIDSA